ncbi:MAG: translocation/assembly module TamB domain-containing protein [Desulfobacteraceae bacterium]
MTNRKPETENQKPKKSWRLLKWLGGILVVVVLLLALFSLLVTTDLFWEWGGPKIVVGVNNRLNGKMTVEKIYGNPLTALVFENILVTGRQGEVLRAQQLKIRFSLLSFLKLKPEINELEINAPRINLAQDQQGRWNFTGLKKKTPPPPFGEIRLPAIQINQGEISLSRPGQEWLIRQLDLRLEGLVIKKPGRADQFIQVQSGCLAFTPPDLPRVTIQSKLLISTEELQLEKLAISLNDQPAAAMAGSLTQLDKLPQLDLDIRLLPLSGQQVRGIWPKWPWEQELSAGLQLAGDIAHSHLTGKIHLGDGCIDLEGELNSQKPDWRLNARFDDLGATILRALAGDRVPPGAKLSPLGGQLRLAGTGLPWGEARMQSSLKIKPFQYNQAEVAEAEASFDIDHEGRQQLKAHIQGNFGRLATHGSGRLVPGLGPEPGLAGNLEIEAKRLNPSLLVGRQAPPGLLEGKFAGQFKWPQPGHLSRLEAKGVLTAKGKLQEYTFQEIRVESQWQQDVLKLPQARLRLAGLRVELRGALQRTGADLKFDLELSPRVSWPLVPAGLRGEVKAQGSFTGSWDAPTLRLIASGRQVAWNRLSVQVLQLSANSRGWPPDVARLELTAQKINTPWLNLAQAQLTGQAEQRRLSFELALNQPQQSVGQVAGTMNLQGKHYLLIIDTCRLGTDKHQVVSQTPIQLRFTPGGFELSPAAFHYQDCTINLGGTADGQSLGFRVGVERFPVAVLNNLWPSVPPLKGDLDLQTEATGSLRSPIINGKLSLSPGRIADFRFQTFQLDWTYAGNQLQLDGQLREKADGPGLLLNGQIPVSLAFRPLVIKAQENGLSIRLRGKKLNLARLADLTPELEAAQGSLDIQAQCTGSLKNPQCTGKIKWGSGFVKLRQAGVPYDLAPGELQLEKEKITLPRLALSSGAGTASLAGNIALAGFQPQTVDARLETANFLALDRAGSRAVANSRITLTGTWPKLEARGQVTIPEAQLAFRLFQPEDHSEIRVIRDRKPSLPPPQKESEDSALWKNLLIKLDIKLPGAVWVREKDIKAQLTGDFRVIKIPPRPLYLAGKIRAEEGSIILNRKVFSIEHALVTFPGSPQGLIMLNARAQHEMKDVTLIIIATGPITNPRTQLESVPPLPQPDILSYLLFDRQASDITRDQAAMGILGGITADKMKEIFGEAIPLVGSLSVTGEGDSVGVGKQLTKDITVYYERNLDPLTAEDVNQFRIDYKLNRFLSLESQFGRRNPGGDIFLNIDF